MKYLNLTVKLHEDWTPVSKVEEAPRLAEYLRGKRVDMLHLKTHMFNQGDVQEVIDFLTQVKHCFPIPPK